MVFGSPGVEQFRRAKVEFRNIAIVAGINPLVTLRQELIACDEASDRTGFDNTTRDHFLRLLINCDKWRRRLTYNPDSRPLGDKIQAAIAVTETTPAVGNLGPSGDIVEPANPFGTDDIQGQSGGIIALPLCLDGTDPDFPMASQLVIKSPHMLLLLGLIDRTIVNWTRLNSRDRTRFITQEDSMRIYGQYQAILGYLLAFGGDKNRVDVVQVLPSDEPLGPTDSPNRKGEVSHGVPMGTNPQGSTK